jgi:hypothetical protein
VLWRGGFVADADYVTISASPEQLTAIIGAVSGVVLSIATLVRAFRTQPESNPNV